MRHALGTNDDLAIPDLESITEALPHGVALVDATGSVLRANGLLLADLGFDAPPAALSVADMVPSAHSAEHPLLALLRRVTDEQLGFDEIECVQWDGSRAVVSIANIADPHGEPRDDVALLCLRLTGGPAEDLTCADIAAAA